MVPTASNSCGNSNNSNGASDGNTTVSINSSEINDSDLGSKDKRSSSNTRSN
jgi:hypothetical protein